MSEPYDHVEEIDVEVPDEPDTPGEGELDPDDTYSEGDGDETPAT